MNGIESMNPREKITNAKTKELRESIHSNSIMKFDDYVRDIKNGKTQGFQMKSQKEERTDKKLENETKSQIKDHKIKETQLEENYSSPEFDIWDMQGEKIKFLTFQSSTRKSLLLIISKKALDQRSI